MADLYCLLVDPRVSFLLSSFSCLGEESMRMSGRARVFSSPRQGKKEQSKKDMHQQQQPNNSYELYFFKYP